MSMGVIMFKRQMQESTKDLGRGNGHKGRRRSSQSGSQKTGSGENFRMKQVNRLTSCRKISRMPMESRQMGLSTSR